MGTKRAAEDTDISRPRPRRENSKRARLSPTPKDNSSDPSSCSVSVDSALQSSPPVSEHTRQSSLSSVQPYNYDVDSEESVSSSTSSDIADNDSDDDIITIGGPKKPHISPSHFQAGSDDLRSRLSAFLPQLAEANEALQDGREIHSMEDVEADEQHIEMNLGLGVLEEKDEDGDSSSSEDSSDVDNKFGQQGDLPASSGTAKRRREDRDLNVMGNLLGKPREGRKVDIEDLG